MLKTKLIAVRLIEKPEETDQMTDGKMEIIVKIDDGELVFPKNKKKLKKTLYKCI